VTYEFSTFAPVGNSLLSKVATYEVNRVTGELVGPVFTADAGDHPWSVVVEPGGNFVYVASISTDEVRVYSVNGANGALTPKPSLQVQSHPAGLAVDPLGRFLYIAKEQPTFNMNLLVYQINAVNGSLSFASGLLTGSGAEVGPIAVTAEPQGQFVYAIDSNSTLLAYKVDANGNLTGEPGPAIAVGVGSSFGGLGSPWTFAASGRYPRWQDRCTHLAYYNTNVWGSIPPGGGQNCYLAATRSASSNAASNNDPPPPPPTHFSLHVNFSGAYGGTVSSSPAGIFVSTDPAQTQTQVYDALFPTGTVVTLTSSPIPSDTLVYDLQWTGSGGCSGTANTTTVTVNSDVSCALKRTPKSP